MHRLPRQFARQFARQLLAAPLVTAFMLVACTHPATVPQGPAAAPRVILQPQQSGTTALLQAVSPVSDQVAWVSGHQGTWARTVDGGATWVTGRVPGADTLQFRDVHAVSADTAILMSAGTGELSRVYRTMDGGKSWELLHTNPDAAGFYDCIGFWDATDGVLFGDSVDGRLVIRVTADGGRSWTTPSGLPEARPGEGGFAASGGCVMVSTARGLDRGWIATGNTTTARVLWSSDRGRSWHSAALPVVAGEGAGATAITFRDGEVGVAVGGDIGRREALGTRVALSRNGGVSWEAGGAPTFAGAVYGVAYVPQARHPTLMLVGPGGADLSYDDGASWWPVDGQSYWSVGFASARSGWLVGPGGRIVHVRVE